MPAQGDWVYSCPQCDHKQSDLQSLDLELSTEERLHDLKAHEKLLPGRVDTLTKIFDQMRALGWQGTAAHPALDVGCASGFLLEPAREMGVHMVGVEADDIAVEAGRAKGREIIQGFFPQALEGSKYDAPGQISAILFLDVIGHFPTLDPSIRAVSRLLSENGMMVIKTPISSGFLYHTARLLSRLGWSAPWQRVWQLGFGAPQIHVFSDSSARELARRHGLDLVHAGRLPAWSFKGLYARIHDNGRHSHIFSAAVWCALSCYILLSRLLPSDSGLYIFQKSKSPAS